MTDISMHPSAPMMIEQALDAYEVLVDAELAYLDSARSAIRSLSQDALGRAVESRTHWCEAVRDTVAATNRLGDSEVDPGSLPLGHAVLDHLAPTSIPSHQVPAVNDLGATPDGVLWVGRDGYLLEGYGGEARVSVTEFRALGGVLLSHRGRWVMAEEALASRFPVGTRVRHTARDLSMTVTSLDAAFGDVPPWRADHYFPTGSVHTTRGWWMAEFLEPAFPDDADEPQ